MIVYILNYIQGYDGGFVHSVHSSKEKAQSLKEKFEKDEKFDKDWDYYEILEFEVQ